MAGEQADEALNELEDLDVISVGLVGKAANRRKYLLLKNFDGGETMSDEQKKVEQEDTEVSAEIEKASTLDEVKTLLASFFKREKETVTEDVEKAEPEAKVDEVKVKVEKATEPEPDVRIEALEKAQAEAKIALEKAQKRAEAAENIAKHERALRLKQEFLEKAQGYGALPAKGEELADLLMWATETDPKRAEYLETLLKAADGAMVESGIFNELGTSAGTEEASPFLAKVKQRAVELRKADTAMSEPEAFAAAFKEVGASDRSAAERYVDERQQATGRR